jgi:hypothetical protein
MRSYTAFAFRIACPLVGAHDSILTRLSLSRDVVARSKIESFRGRQELMRCEISASSFVAIQGAASAQRCATYANHPARQGPEIGHDF